MPLSVTEAHVDRRVLTALAYVGTRYASGSISLASAAQLVRLSPGYLNRLVRQATGKSFVQHVDMARQEKSTELLSDSFLTVKEIAAAVGYSSSTVFDRAFRRAHGVTPREWRRTRAR